MAPGASEGRWGQAVTDPSDPGPGKRSGEGSMTVLPYVVKSLAGQLQSDDPPADGS